MAKVDEIAPNVFRISVHVPNINLQFNEFLIRDEEPLHDAIPYTTKTASTFARLAALAPQTLAIMHGASFRGDGAGLLLQFEHELARIQGA